jgi:hypothetical protein
MKILAVTILCIAGIATWLFRASEDVAIELVNEPARLEFYDHGKLSRAVSLPAQSEFSRAVAKLLEKKKGKWRTSLSSFAPVQLLRGKSWTLNFQAKRIIANVPSQAGKPIQVITTLTDEEAAILDKAVKSASER